MPFAPDAVAAQVDQRDISLAAVMLLNGREKFLQPLEVIRIARIGDDIINLRFGAHLLPVRRQMIDHILRYPDRRRRLGVIPPQQRLRAQP